MSNFDERRIPADLDDLPPTGDEARAEARETVMPLIWIGLGVVVILLFLTLALCYQGPGDNRARFAPSRAAIPGPP
jgi:hypothetical protein